MLRILTAAVLCAGLSTAYAEDSSKSSTPSVSEQDTQLPQELRQRLEHAGFTNVQIEPTAYVVSARDKAGNKTLMEIGPDSMTVLTLADNSSTTGSGASGGQSGSSTPGSSTPGSSTPGSTAPNNDSAGASGQSGQSPNSSSTTGSGGSEMSGSTSNSGTLGQTSGGTSSSPHSTTTSGNDNAASDSNH